MFEDRNQENPLAGLGSTSSGATATVSPSGGGSSGLPSSSGAPPRAPRTGSETPLVLLWALVTLAVGAFVLQRAEHKALHDPVQIGQRGGVSATSRLSLVRPANLAHVLRSLRAHMHAGETFTSLRLAPTSVSADIRTPGGSERIVDVDLGYKVTSRSFGDTSFRGAPLRVVDPAGPARLLAAAHKHAHGGRLDYVVVDVSNIDGGVGLNMFLKGVANADDKQWMSDVHGRDVHRPGEPSAAQKTADHALKTGIEASALRQAKQQLRAAGFSPACLRKAHTVAALQRCAP